MRPALIAGLIRGMATVRAFMRPVQATEVGVGA